MDLILPVIKVAAVCFALLIAFSLLIIAIVTIVNLYAYFLVF